MTRWEYKTYLLERDDKVVDILNRFGADGWEAFYLGKVDYQQVRILFKRPKPVPVGESK